MPRVFTKISIDANEIASMDGMAGMSPSSSPSTSLRRHPPEDYWIRFRGHGSIYLFANEAMDDHGLVSDQGCLNLLQSAGRSSI